MSTDKKINWYRCKVDKQVMSPLMETSDFKGFRQVLPQLGLFVVTSALTYLSLINISASSWEWAVPLCILAWFIHGTFSSFLGLTGPVHELCHKTPFKSKSWNEFFLKVYSFLSWSDPVSFRPSHVRHHQVTVHHDLDEEVVLPMSINPRDIHFWMWAFGFNIRGAFNTIRDRASEACGVIRFEYTKKVIPESNVKGRLEHKRWAQTMVGGHILLAAIFILTGHWPLIFIVNLGAFYFAWLAIACGMPQHIGMQPDISDFRKCCRTYTCNWLPGFLYWNMQYHVEHHMFPAVPFYNLPKLRQALTHDLPPAPHGLIATWKEIIHILKLQKQDPAYCFQALIPQNSTPGEMTDDSVLEKEASAAV